MTQQGRASAAVESPGVWVEWRMQQRLRGRCGAHAAARSRGAPEQHDVRLRAVDGVVHPAARLLHAQSAPLVLRGP
jgi:hypothetical protein